MDPGGSIISKDDSTLLSSALPILLVMPFAVELEAAFRRRRAAQLAADRPRPSEDRFPLLPKSGAVDTTGGVDGSDPE